MLIRSLEIFRAVVDTGSFSAAAERLHTVQSNVTAHIKKLETELDARLLERRTPVVPTPAGRQLLSYAPPPRCTCRACYPPSAGAGRIWPCTCAPALPRR